MADGSRARKRREPMSRVDTAWLRMERATNLMMITSVMMFEETMSPGLEGLGPGDEVLVLTWLDRAFRDVLRVRPRDDFNRPHQGVFSTRSPDRPNPIGLHRVTIVAIDGSRVTVRNLEALDGTPVIDVKPLLRTVHER